MRTLTLISFLLSTSAQAADVTLTLNDEQQRIFFQVLDAAANSQVNRPGGLEMAKMVAFMNNLFAAAAVRPQLVPPPPPGAQ